MVDFNLEKDYQDFLKKEDDSPTEKVSNHVLSMVAKELDPRMSLVFFKLFVIHFFVGSITLLFCPQFSLSITGYDTIFHFFHATLGMSGCMVVCGSIFVGSGALAANFLLKTPEARKIHQYSFIVFSLISFLFLLCLSFFGQALDISLAMFWLLGAITGSITMFKLGNFFKSKLVVSFSFLRF